MSNRLTNSPSGFKNDKTNSQPGKNIKSILFEDLTEITSTDLMTGRSDTSKSIMTKNAWPLEASKLKVMHEHNQIKNNPSWILVAPDSYENSRKFNQKVERQNLSLFYANRVINKELSGPFNLPLLKIDFPNDFNDKRLLLNNVILSPDFENETRQLNNGDYNFLVSPEVLLNRKRQNENNHLNNLTPKSCNNTNKEFILKNLLKVDLKTLDDASYVENPSINLTTSKKSSSHIINNKENKLISSVIMEDLSCNDDNITIVEDDTTENSLSSDAVLYHGYLITPDSIQKVQSKKSSEKRSIKEIIDIQNPQISDRNKFNLSLSENGFNINDSKNKKEYIIPAIIEKAPILPPDMLGNIKLTNGNEVKRFLSVKSVDDSSWHGFDDIILDDNYLKNNEKENIQPKTAKSRSLKILDVDTNFKDELTSNILESDFQNSSKNYNIKNNLVKSLKEMDKKINEIEKISSVMESNFSNSKKLLLDVNRSNGKSKNLVQNKSVNNNEQFPSLVLIGSHNDKDSNKDILNQTETDFSKISSNGLTKRDNNSNTITDTQVTNHLIVENLSKLNLNEYNSDEDTILNDQILTMASGTSSYFSVHDKNRLKKPLNVKRSHLMQNIHVRNTNRKIRDQNIIMKRKVEARKFANKVLNEVGLPNMNSAEIPLTIINNPTPNEMMLSQLYKNERQGSSIKYQPKTNENCSLTYKPIRHVSFTNKVRLQRPEITRHTNGKKAVSYTDQLLALQPQHEKKRQILTKNISGKRNSIDQSPRSIVSQDTDMNSMLTDWSVPDNVKKLLNESSHRDGLEYIEDTSQIQSLNSNSVIDWDQISDMLRKHEK